MSLRSMLPRGGAAIVVGITMSATLGAIIYSHYSQVRDRETMRAGVERDKERLRIKREQRKLREQQEQQARPQ